MQKLNGELQLANEKLERLTGEASTDAGTAGCAGKATEKGNGFEKWRNGLQKVSGLLSRVDAKISGIIGGFTKTKRRIDRLQCKYRKLIQACEQDHESASVFHPCRGHFLACLADWEVDFKILHSTATKPTWRYPVCGLHWGSCKMRSRRQSAPLLEALAPALIKIIELATIAVTAIGQLFASTDRKRHCHKGNECL